MKGMIFLSFVIGYVSTKMAAIASDGRCCYTDGTIKTEFYNKTRKINNNVIIGYSGSTKACEKILSQLQLALEQIQKNGMREPYVNEVAACIHAIIPMFNFPKEHKVQFIISGISNNKEMQLYTFGNTNQTDFIPLIATEKEIQIAALCSSKSNESGCKIFKNHLINDPFVQHTPIDDIFKASIEEMADLDPTVNRNCFSQVIFPISERKI